MKKNALYKGTLQNIVLKLLAKEVKMYGYQITQRAKELTKGELEMTEGALYPILHKLENEGIIFSEMQTVNGRDRKYYLLTEKGHTFLNELHETWTDLANSVQQIIQPSNIA